MTRLAVALVLGTALLGACAGLPDVGRGRAALARGDREAAERNFKPLAEEGFLDAQVQLAKVHSKAETPQELQEAAFWYESVLERDPSVALQLARVLLKLGDVQSMTRAEALLHAADARGDARALAALIEVYTNFPELDTGKSAPALVERASALQSPEAEGAVIHWYRQHATEPRYATALVERCTKARDRIPECYIDLARADRASGQKAALKEMLATAMARYKSGDLPPEVMERLGWALVADDVAGEAYPDSAYEVIKAVGENSPQAKVRLARLLVEYPYVDPLGKPEQLLLSVVDKNGGDADAALGLGRLYMNGVTVPVDFDKAVKYLEQASLTLPAAHYYLGRIFRKGQLGKPDPVRAAEHFLLAARGGYANADVALAQLYSDNRGVRPNLANAYVFASIAASAAVPDGKELLNQLQPSMSRKQVQDGQKLLQDEIAVRRGTLMTAASSLPPAQSTKPESAP
jgi:alginate biosynthesis protein AlgK